MNTFKFTLKLILLAFCVAVGVLFVAALGGFILLGTAIR